MGDKKLESYTKVVQLGQRMIEDILDGEIIVEEKVDGSQFRAMITKDKKLLFGSKSVSYSDERPPEKMFSKAIESAKEALSKLDTKDNIQIYGEFLQKPRQNTLSYERTPENNIVLFDAKYNGEWLTYEEKCVLAKKLGFEVVSLLYRGDGKKLTKEKIDEILKTKSFLGKELIEGIVVKNYNKFHDCIKYPYLEGMFLVGKFVREEFKELNKANWKKLKKGPVETLIESLRTEARWEKAFQHLRDNGKILGEPKDIPEIMKEIVKDVEAEEGENIKEMLWNHYWKNIKRGMVKGVPEWYKGKLLENVVK